MIRFNRLIAIDPSLTSSGWALFSLESSEIISYGIIKPPGATISLSKRLDTLQLEVSKLFLDFELNESDVLVCEGPAHLVLNPSSSLKVERVRSIFESVARMRGVTVPGRINPKTVQSELLGLKGKQRARKEVKEAAGIVCQRLYGEHFSTASQDIIDALLIATVVMAKIKQSQNFDMPLEESFEGGKKNSFHKRSKKRWTEKQLVKIQNL